MNKLFIFLSLLAITTALPRKQSLRNLPKGECLMKGPFPPLDKNGLVDTRYRWPNGVVAYQYDSTLSSSEQTLIENAMQTYRDVTGGCIDFQPRTTESDYILFKQNPLDSGCWSYVGRLGGAQEINYPTWCVNDPPSVLHEMYHALGFYHEQSRFDRDNYVTIMYQNIEPGMEYNFDLYPESYANGFGEPYDYTSVMHYYQYAFSTNGQPTIVTTVML